MNSDAVTPGQGLILAYHRVADVPSDPWGLAVSQRHFAEHVDVLRRRMRPISRAELAGAVQAGTTLAGAVVVTFDDGYADNFSAAKPVLDACQVPATVFLVSGHLDPPRPFWWDVLEAVFLRPGALPSTLQLIVDGQRCEWSLGPSAALTEEDLAPHRAWRAWMDPPTPRHQTYLSLWQRLRPLPDHAQQEVISRLLAWAGFSAGHAEGIPTPRRLSRDEISSLRGDALIELGAHTATHPLLPAVSASTQLAEIRESRATLVDLLGRNPVGFAYPYGEHSDETVDIVRAQGFRVACAANPAAIARPVEPFRLPRCAGPD